MKSLLLIIVVCLSRGVFSQEIDTIQSRWIEISLDSINEDLFTIVDDLPLLRDYLSNDDTLLFYEEASATEGAYKKYLSFYPIWDSASLLNKTVDDLEKNNIPLRPKDNPYVDSNGYEIAVWCEPYDLSTCFIYPIIDYYTIQTIDFDKIIKIRIREDFLFDEDSNKHKFVVTGISFVKKDFDLMNSSASNRELKVMSNYWIDLRRFIQIVNKIDAPWVKTILTKSYSGFQYMQMK